MRNRDRFDQRNLIGSRPGLLMRNKMTRRMTYIISACVAISAAVGLATALAASSSGSAPAPSSIVPQLGTAAKAHFSVFAQPQADSEEVARVSETLQGLDVKLNPSSVRLAQSSGDLQVRVAGDSQSVCLALRIPGKADAGSCAPEASAASPATPIIQTTGYPAGEVSRPGGQLAVSVLFADGITNAAITHAGGAPTAVKIVDNTIVLVASEGDTLTWSGPEGKTYSSRIGV